MPRWYAPTMPPADAAHVPNRSQPVRVDLAADLDSAYSGLRLALVQVLRSAGIDPRSGGAIASSLSINRQLSWQLATIASEASCADGLHVLPGTRGLQLFANAAARSLGEHPSLDQFAAALQTLERAVAHHAGDRASLGLLTAAWAPSSIEARTDALRRDGFRAQCALLGVQAATQIRGVIYAPSRVGDAGAVAMATYQCFHDLMRLRADRACRLLFVEAPTHDDGSPAMPVDEMRAHMREKFELDPELSAGRPEEVELITQGGRGWVTLRPGALGRAAATSYAFTGCARYEHPRYRSARDRYNQVGIVSYVPTETIYIDCLIDRSLAEHEGFVQSIECSCFDAATGMPMRPVSRSDPAFLFDLASPVPLSPTELACDPSAPELYDLVDRAARRVGTRVDDLVGVRFRSTFAMSPSDFVITRTLPEAPGASPA